MSATETIVARDIYYCITNAKGSRIHQARVWDAERFLSAQREAGMKAKEPADRFTVSPATEDQYKAQKHAGR